jgi:uncharacterized protein
MAMTIFLYILVGFAGGVVSGIFGIGGGTILIPLMVILFGLTQHQAQGTSLAALLPPVFLFAVLRYYWAGNVKIQMAAFIALGFLFGGLLGANMIQNISDVNLKRAFAVYLMIVAIKMFIK